MLVKILSPMKAKCIAAGTVIDNAPGNQGQGNTEDDNSTKYILANWSVTYGSEPQLAEELQQGRLIVVSNRSYFPETRRAAFQVRIESTN